MSWNRRLPELRVPPVTGSGPHGRVELSDIRAKLVEIRGDVEETAEEARPYLVFAAVGAAIAVVTAAFLMGILLAVCLGAPDLIAVALFGGLIYALGSLTSSGSRLLSSSIGVYLGEVSFASDCLTRAA